MNSVLIDLYTMLFCSPIYIYTLSGRAGGGGGGGYPDDDLRYKKRKEKQLTHSDDRQCTTLKEVCSVNKEKHIKPTTVPEMTQSSRSLSHARHAVVVIATV